MGASVIKFEARVPILVGDGGTQDTAISAFLSGIAALSPYTFENNYQVTSGGAESQYNLTFGLLTSAQATSALALLNTLNAAIGTPIVCYNYPVTLQP
jgi:hypothetical protein